MQGTTIDDARRIESEFLTAMEGHLDEACPDLPGEWFRRFEGDERDRLRELMSARRLFDARLLDRLPNNRRVSVVGYVRPWYRLGRKRVSAMTASTLVPFEAALEAAARQDDAGSAGIEPVDADDLARHVDDLAAAGPKRCVIGVCSPAGFTDAARELSRSWPGVTLVLIEPHASGGWLVTGVSGERLDSAVGLFDVEGETGRRRRIRRAIDDRRTALILDGLSAADVAEALAVQRSLVEEVFAEVSRADGHLHVTAGGRGSILYHTSADVKETPPMSVMDFLRRILGRGESPEKKIASLRERQAKIDEQRTELEKVLSDLTGEEERLLDKGAAESSESVKRGLATQLSQLRQRITLQREKVSILNKQSQILGRQIHNLDVATFAKPADLPDAEEITEAAASAEASIEELNDAYEAVRTVSVATTEESLMGDEGEILAEFEARAAKKDEAAPAEGSAEPSAAEQGREEIPPRPERQREREEPGREAT